MKKIFAAFFVMVCCYSAYSQTASFEIVQNNDVTTFTIPHGQTKIDVNNDGTPDSWLAYNSDYLQKIYIDYTGEETWIPQEKESFVFSMEGNSKFSGKMVFVIADDSETANGWAVMSTMMEVDVLEGKTIEKKGYLTINNTTLQTTSGQNGNIGDEVAGGLMNPKLFVGLYPSQEMMGQETDFMFEFTTFTVEYKYADEFVVLPIPDITAEIGTLIPRIKLSDYFISEPEDSVDYEIWIEPQEEGQELHEESALFQAKVIHGELCISAFATGVYRMDVMAFSRAKEGEGSCSITVTVKEKQVVGEEPCNITLKETITPVSCMGERDGSIVVEATGGVEPYSYRWNTGRSDNGVYHMNGGIYTIVVEDSLGCIATGMYEIPENYLYTYPTMVEADCGVENGSITFNDEEYTYTWSDGEVTPHKENLGAGMYTVLLTDTSGCTASRTYHLVSGSMYVYGSNFGSVKCGESNGKVIMHAYGGVEPYTFSFDGEVVEGDTKEGISAGEHVISVVDANGCYASSEQHVWQETFPQPEIYSVSYAEDSKSILVMWTFDSEYYYEDDVNYMDYVDYFTVYRETSEQKGDYDSIGYVKSSFPLYQDYDLSESNGSYRYKITATDYCGETSPLGFSENKSIGLTMTTETTSEGKKKVNLSWTPYEGQFFDSYSIYRITKDEKLEVAKVAPNKTTYSEVLTSGTKGYFVGVSFPDTLYFDENNTPLLKAESGPFSLAISNIAEVENVDAVGTVAKNSAVVYGAEKSIVVVGVQSRVSVFDLQGKCMVTDSVNKEIMTIPMEKTGVYLVLVDGIQVFEVLVK